MANDFEAILRRDRGIVLASLVAVTGLAWAYLAVMAADMGGVSIDGMAVARV